MEDAQELALLAATDFEQALEHGGAQEAADTLSSYVLELRGAPASILLQLATSFRRHAAGAVAGGAQRRSSAAGPVLDLQPYVDLQHQLLRVVAGCPQAERGVQEAWSDGAVALLYGTNGEPTAAAVDRLRSCTALLPTLLAPGSLRCLPAPADHQQRRSLLACLLHLSLAPPPGLPAEALDELNVQAVPPWCAGVVLCLPAFSTAVHLPCRACAMKPGALPLVLVPACRRCQHPHRLLPTGWSANCLPFLARYGSDPLHAKQQMAAAFEAFAAVMQHPSVRQRGGSSSSSSRHGSAQQHPPGGARGHQVGAGQEGASTQEALPFLQLFRAPLPAVTDLWWAHFAALLHSLVAAAQAGGPLVLRRPALQPLLHSLCCSETAHMVVQLLLAHPSYSGGGDGSDEPAAPAAHTAGQGRKRGGAAGKDGGRDVASKGSKGGGSRKDGSPREALAMAASLLAHDVPAFLAGCAELLRPEANRSLPVRVEALAGGWPLR